LFNRTLRDFADRLFRQRQPQENANLRRNTMSTKSRLITGLKIGGAAAAFAAATPLYAQDQPVPSQVSDAQTAANEDEVIFVTARRRVESITNVPLSITAYSGEELENEGALDITDIGDTTPNVTLEASRGTNSTLTAFIRGVGQQDPVAGFESGVGIYLDDVYLNRPQACLLDIYNVERIEVLRGPQGTLYGRNTIGGAIKYVTRRMPADAELRVRGTIGTDEQADLIVSASTPVSSDRSVASAARSRGCRATASARTSPPAATITIATSGPGGCRSSQQRAQRLRSGCRATSPRTIASPRGGHRLIPGLVSGAPVLEDEFDSRGGLLDPEQDVRAYGVSLYAEVQPFDDWTLRSITAYRKDQSSTPIDFDALPAVDVDVPGVYNNNQLSQELQVLYNSGPVNLLFGAYYLDANAQTIFDVRLPGGITRLTFGDVDTETYALFGDFSYDIRRHVQRLGRRPLHLGPADLGHLAPGLSRRRRLALLRRHRHSDRACNRTSPAPPTSRSSRRAPR
jgi:iron complex outermembrane receptor protein